MRRLLCIHRQYKRILITVLLVSLMLFGSVGQALARPSAYPTEWWLGIPNVRQENTNWCWAACSISILRYYGKDAGISQCTFVKWVKSPFYCPNEPAYCYEVQSGLAHWGVCSDHTGSLPFSTIIAETYTSRRPIIALWMWNGADIGHFVAPEGYDDDFSGQDYVYYMEPVDGSLRCATYAWFAGLPGANSNHTWVESIYHIKPC